MLENAICYGKLKALYRYFYQKLLNPFFIQTLIEKLPNHITTFLLSLKSFNFFFSLNASNVANDN